MNPFVIITAELLGGGMHGKGFGVRSRSVEGVK